jgi:hypothetical protein
MYLTENQAKLSSRDVQKLQKDTFYGKEIKSLAYIIGVMNMILHGIEAPNIRHYNTLSDNINDIQEKDRYNVILANPPFGAGIGREIQQNFPIKTGETAFLFLQHFINLITAKNVKLGYLQRTPEEFINPKDYDGWMTRGIPKKGDVLFTTEAPLANVAQLDTDEKVVFAQRIIILQPQPNKIDQTFLKYMLLSKPIRQRLIEKGTGATVQGIKASLLRKIEIYFPSNMKEQQSIVAKLDALSAETKKLESIYKQKLSALEELKKSVLQKAFSGGL